MMDTAAASVQEIKTTVVEPSTCCFVAYVLGKTRPLIIQTSSWVHELRAWADEAFRLNDVFDRQEEEDKGWTFDPATELYHPRDSLELKGVGRIRGCYAATGSSADAVKLFKKHVAIEKTVDIANPQSVLILYLVEVVSCHIYDAYQVMNKITSHTILHIDKSTCMLGFWVCNKVPFVPIKVVPSSDVQELEDYLLKEFPTLQIESKEERQVFIPISQRSNEPDDWSLNKVAKEGGYYEYQVPVANGKGCLAAKAKIQAYLDDSVCFHNFVTFFIVKCEDGLIPSCI